MSFLVDQPEDPVDAFNRFFQAQFVDKVADAIRLAYDRKLISVDNSLLKVQPTRILIALIPGRLDFQVSDCP